VHREQVGHRHLGRAEERELVGGVGVDAERAERDVRHDVKDRDHADELVGVGGARHRQSEHVLALDHLQRLVDRGRCRHRHEVALVVHQEADRERLEEVLFVLGHSCCAQR